MYHSSSVLHECGALVGVDMFSSARRRVVGSATLVKRMHSLPLLTRTTLSGYCSSPNVCAPSRCSFFWSERLRSYEKCVSLRFNDAVHVVCSSVSV